MKISTQTTQRHLVLLKVDTTTHRVDHRLGLLVDFLLHKVIKRTLHDLGKFDFKSLDFSRSGRGVLFTTETMDVKLYDSSKERRM